MVSRGARVSFPQVSCSGPVSGGTVPLHGGLLLVMIMLLYQTCLTNNPSFLTLYVLSIPLHATSDTDGSGEIDLTEFKVALFILDPDGGNTVGFKPNSLLGPRDAFDLYDQDRSGTLDEDEFALALEYMKMPGSDGALERLFAKYDADGSGSIEYGEFRTAWLGLADPKKELDARNIGALCGTAFSSIENPLTHDPKSTTTTITTITTTTITTTTFRAHAHQNTISTRHPFSFENS